MRRDLLEKLLSAAAMHGIESEPDHEVGDLQTIVRACWKHMTLQQQLEVYELFKELVEKWTRGKA